MILKLHKNLTVEKWRAFGVDRQMLMAGNEVNRLKNALHEGRSRSEVIDNFERLFELIDLTVAVNRGGLVKELLRIRDIFASEYIRKEEDKGEMQKDMIDKLYSVFFSLNKTLASTIGL